MRLSIAGAAFSCAIALAPGIANAEVHIVALGDSAIRGTWPIETRQQECSHGLTE
jgi:hypothetical protein